MDTQGVNVGHFPRASLDGLPNELLSQIFSYFPCPTGHDSNSPLICIVRVSRRFRDLTQPLMYRKLSFPDFTAENYYHQRIESYNHNPALCVMAQSFRARVGMREELQARQSLLRLLPNLRDVTLWFPSTNSLLDRSLLELPHAGQLQSFRLDLSPIPRRDGFPESNVMPSMRMPPTSLEQEGTLQFICRHIGIPSLRRLAVDQLYICLPEDEVDKFFSLHKTAQLPFTSLELSWYYSSSLGPATSMMDCAKALSFFVIRFLPSYWEIKETFPLVTIGENFNTALRRHKNTIQKLSIYSEYFARFDPANRMANLVDFGMLTSLTIPESLFNGAFEQLPKCLKMLRLQHQPEGYTSSPHSIDAERAFTEARLRVVLAGLQRRPVSLEKIIWWEKSHPWTFYERLADVASQALQEIARDFGKAAIKLTFSNRDWA